MENNKPIGIILPIRNGNGGYFDQSFDTLTQVKSNIYNLLSTRPGERRMQPTFGSRLWSLVFEQSIEEISEIAVNIIKEDIASWIPGVTVVNVTTALLKNEDKDIYKLNISVLFALNIGQQTSTVDITIDNMTI